MRWTLPLCVAVVALVAALPTLTPVLVHAAVAPAEQATMLAAHNKLRRDVAPAAETQRLGRTVSIPDLAWDAAAAATAQAWADHLIAVGTLDHNTGRGAYGENLATFENSAPFPIPNPSGADVAFSSWKAESVGYVWDTNTCTAAECGHYKQAVWASATGLGCGVATGSGVLIPGGFRTVWACYYTTAATAGRPYEAGGVATPTPTPAPGVGGTPAPGGGAGADGGFSGAAPSRGQVGLLVTSRVSSAPGLAAALSAGGCTAASIAVLQVGQWKVYVVGAPTVVNSAFPASLPNGTPFFVRCQP